LAFQAHFKAIVERFVVVDLIREIVDEERTVVELRAAKVDDNGIQGFEKKRYVVVSNLIG